MVKDNNGWDEYKRLILSSLESLQKEVACLKKDHELRKEDFSEFITKYESNIAKVKVYLTIGVAVGTGLLQLGLYYVQMMMERH